MKKYIIQHAIGDQVELLNLTKPVNQAYATTFGLQYRSDTTSRCPERAYEWEKIAYLKEILSKTEDGNIVAWEDADSLNIGDQDVTACLPTGAVFGMVQNRGGLNNSLLIHWYNSGVMVIVNSPTIRSFFDRVWARGGKDDEVAIMAELAASTDIAVTAIDPKWNCWRNNENIVTNPIIKTFHGIKLSAKLAAIELYLNGGGSSSSSDIINTSSSSSGSIISSSSSGQ